jgi:hypothetical protein
MVTDYKLFDVVMLKKAHPCKARGKLFQIVMMGADIKIRCLACGNLLLLPRDKFNASVKKIVSSHEGPIKDLGQK